MLQADGVRTAVGAYVAFALAIHKLLKTGKIARNVVINEVAAVSVGIVGNVALLDLKYDEDSTAEVDMNVVCTGDGRFIEVQERLSAKHSHASRWMAYYLAEKGVQQLMSAQRDTIRLQTG